MRFPRLAAWLFDKLLLNVAAQRSPDFIVGADNPAGAYLHRWFVVPRNRWLNVYLHEFLRDDDDRALHDHPWPWCSILLHGSYVEHTIAKGGIHCRRLRRAGSVKASGPWLAHRVELLREVVVNDDPIVRATDPAARCWTLFITGPRIRSWGFHCPERGWVHYKQFTAAGKPGEIGPGCDA